MQHAPAPACDSPPLSKTCLSKTIPQFTVQKINAFVIWFEILININVYLGMALD